MGIAGRDVPAYSAPAAVGAHHRLDRFHCGDDRLDEWLRRRALASRDKASRTYVVTDRRGDDKDVVVAFYALAYGSLVRREDPRRTRTHLPNPVAVMVLGRLAVDVGESGRGIGAGLLREALLRAAQASRSAGLRAVVVHAFDDDALGFYAKYGFQPLVPGTRTLFLPVETIRQAIIS